MFTDLELNEIDDISKQDINEQSYSSKSSYLYASWH